MDEGFLTTSSWGNVKKSIGQDWQMRSIMALTRAKYFDQGAEVLTK
jgi:hypothetical protein